MGKYEWKSEEEKKKEEQLKKDESKIPSLQEQIEAQAEALQELIELMTRGG